MPDAPLSSTSVSLPAIRDAGSLPRSLTAPLPGHIIAASEEMRELVSVVRAIAPTSITVLLIGESGTGKEVFAEMIHQLSGRSGPFVTVNCGAIPEGLIESELFGHEKGAFTGAVVQRKGFFESAVGGTLFLDEIGEMPLALQVKLLRVLETGKFTRVGSTTLLSTDARIIAATNRDLEVDVRSGGFRSDLYYRLRAVMLRLPPLRNRRDDIPFLIEVMLDELVKKHRITDARGRLRMPQLTPDAVELLMQHEWRGNIRELRNTLEQVIILVCSINRDNDECMITAHDVQRALHSETEIGWQRGERSLPITTPGKDQTERELIYRALLELRNELAEIKAMLKPSNGHITSTLALPESTVQPNGNSQGVKSLDQLETDAMLHALEQYHGNRRNAADALGISERTLYRKLKEKGLDNNV